MIKPYYEDDLVTLYKGDCRDILPQLEKVDLILTDPPYVLPMSGGGSINRDCKNMKRLRNANITDFEFESYIPQILKNQHNHHAYFFCSKNQLHDYIGLFKDLGLSWDLLILNKKNPVPACNNSYISDNEYILFCRGKQCHFTNKLPVESYKKIKQMIVKDRGFDHPTIKPLSVIEELLIVSSKENQIILDPFAGSGTTGLACKRLNRKCILIEKEEKYCNIIVERLSGVKTIIQAGIKTKYKKGLFV